jgi:hypothetical protein
MSKVKTTSDTAMHKPLGSDHTPKEKLRAKWRKEFPGVTDKELKGLQDFLDGYASAVLRVSIVGDTIAAIAATITLAIMKNSVFFIQLA